MPAEIHMDVYRVRYSYYLVVGTRLPGQHRLFFTGILLPCTIFTFYCRHFVPNLTFRAPVVKCLRKRIPDTFFGKKLRLNTDLRNSR